MSTPYEVKVEHFCNRIMGNIAIILRDRDISSEKMTELRGLLRYLSPGTKLNSLFRICDILNIEIFDLFKDHGPIHPAIPDRRVKKV